jgi:hypothetical protein
MYNFANEFRIIAASIKSRREKEAESYGCRWLILMAAGTKAIDMFPRTDAKKRFTDINSINPSRVECVVLM